MRVGVMMGPERGDAARKVTRMLPIGDGRDELIASKRRTREVLAGIAADRR